jgi:hypothetical protein
MPCFYGAITCPEVDRCKSNHAEDIPDDPAVLKVMITALQAENAKISATLRVHDQLVQALRLRISKLQKPACGRSSEKIEREIEQLELALEDLLLAVAEGDEAPIDQGQDEQAAGDLFAPAPSQPILGSMAGLNLLVHVPLWAIQASPAGQWVSKFGDHLSLNRQHEIFARKGADIPETTLIGWVKTLSPLIEPIEADNMGSDLLHADDTPIRVLDRSLRDKGLGKGVRQGRIRANVSDQRHSAGSTPPRSIYYFARDWKERHVLNHLAASRGILLADGYKGYAKEPDGTPACARRPVGRTCAVTSTTSGHPPSPRLPARPST